MPRRLDAGALVAAVGGVLLLLSLFLDWYGDADEGASAWTVFEVVDLLLAAIGLLALSSFLSRSEIERRLPDVPLVLLGAGAIALVLSQLVNEPPLVQLSDEVDLKAGGWLGLAGAALVLAGGLISNARVSFSVERQDVDGEGGPSAAEPAAPAASEPETVKLDEPPA